MIGNTTSHSLASPSSVTPPPCGTTTVSVDATVNQRKLDHSSKICDRVHPKIYIKKIELAAANKGQRAYDTVHACMFCKKLYANIQSHMERQHKKERSVVTCLELKTMIKSCVDAATKKEWEKQLTRLQDLLRHSGDNKHNVCVIAQKEGEILLSRRSKDTSFHCGDYGPCPSCNMWLHLNVPIVKHQQTCVAFKNINLQRDTLIRQSYSITGRKRNVIKKNQAVLKKIEQSMRNDKIKDICLSDAIITQLGEEWYMEGLGNPDRRCEYASTHMRTMAKLLLKCEELARERHIEDLEECTMDKLLVPEHFSLVAEAALKCASKERKDVAETADLESPSVVGRIGFDLSKMATTKLCLALENLDQKTKQEALDFLELMNRRWGMKVNRIASMAELEMKKRVLLPSPKDIETVTVHIKGQIDVILQRTQKVAFDELQKITMARLFLYNRRRAGELEGFQ